MVKLIITRIDLQMTACHCIDSDDNALETSNVLLALLALPQESKRTTPYLYYLLFFVCFYHVLDMVAFADTPVLIGFLFALLKHREMHGNFTSEEELR